MLAMRAFLLSIICMNTSVVGLNNKFQAPTLLVVAEELVEQHTVILAEWLRCATVTRVINMLRHGATMQQVSAMLAKVNGMSDEYLENW